MKSLESCRYISPCVLPPGACAVLNGGVYYLLSLCDILGLNLVCFLRRYFRLFLLCLENVKLPVCLVFHGAGVIARFFI